MKDVDKKLGKDVQMKGWQYGSNDLDLEPVHVCVGGG